MGKSGEKRKRSKKSWSQKRTSCRLTYWKEPRGRMQEAESCSELQSTRKAALDEHRYKTDEFYYPSYPKLDEFRRRKRGCSSVDRSSLREGQLEEIPLELRMKLLVAKAESNVYRCQELLDYIATLSF